MNIHVVALLKFKENHLLEAKELLKKLISETRKEQGCLQYDLIEDTDKGYFFVVEIWETTEALQQHNKQEHLVEFKKNAIPLMEAPLVSYKGGKIL